MRILELEPSGPPAVGLANGPHVVGFLDRRPGEVDYVETTFEQLRHDPSAAALQERIPFIFHCASLSVGGCVRPDEATMAQIEEQATRTGTPWIGEHLAFILAHALDEESVAEVERRAVATKGAWIGDQLPGLLAHPAHEVVDTRSGRTTMLTYTVCPQLSREMVATIADNVAFLARRFAKPILLENPPQYFTTPGSEMPLVDFMVDLFGRCDAGLLMDLTHFVISARNMGFDASREIERLPLERIVEVHVSGIGEQSGVAWDDHAKPAPEQVFELLEQIERRARPRAVTLEYNWAPDFSDDIVLRNVERVREAFAAARAGSA